MRSRAIERFRNHRSRSYFGPGADEVVCRRSRSRKAPPRWVASGRFPLGIVHVLEPAGERGWIVKTPEASDDEARRAPLAEGESLKRALELYLAPVWREQLRRQLGPFSR